MSESKSTYEQLGCFKLLGIISMFLFLVFPYVSLGFYSIFKVLGAYDPGYIPFIIGLVVAAVLLADVIDLINLHKSQTISRPEKLRLNLYYVLGVLNLILLISTINMFDGSKGEEAIYVVISCGFLFSACLVGLFTFFKNSDSQNKPTASSSKGTIQNHQEYERAKFLKEQREHEIKLAKIKHGRSTFNFGNWWINKVIAPVIIGCILGAVSYIFTGEANIGGITSIGGFVGSMLLNIDYT